MTGVDGSRERSGWVTVGEEEVVVVVVMVIVGRRRSLPVWGKM